MYRIIDFKRNKYDIPAKVSTVEYDPEPLGAPSALLTYADGEKRYNPAAGRHQGRRHDRVRPETSTSLPGNSLPLKNIPLGTLLPQRWSCGRGKGGADSRAAPGRRCSWWPREGDYASVKMPSGEISQDQHGMLRHDRPGGQTSTTRNVSIGKAGRSRWKGQRPPRARRGDEPGRPSAGRRRGQDLGRPAPGDAVGHADQGLPRRANSKTTDRYIVQRRQK